MSKSLGNAIDPLQMIKEMGADILRLWVSSADYRNDISVSNNIIKQSSEAYRKIRNTCRFILGNLYDFDPQQNSVEYEQLSELDKWALLKLEQVVRRVTKAYADYEFHVVFHTVHKFCTVDLSNIYFDIIKDRLYCNDKDDPARRGSQTVLYRLINDLVVILAPILAFTCEEIWTYIRTENDPVSVQLLPWPQIQTAHRDEVLEQKIDRILQVREVTSKAMEEARGQKIIGHSLGAWLTIYADTEWQELLENTEQLDKVLIVSKVDVQPAANRSEDAIALDEVSGVWVSVQAAEGHKCERCWIIDLSVGANPKHESLCKRCAQVVEQMEE